MTQKHIALTVLAVVATGAALIAVPEHFGERDASTGESAVNDTRGSGEGDKMTREDVVVPSSIEEITASIESETAADMTALDEEESGAAAEIEEDSASVNNLGTSYDENSL